MAQSIISDIVNIDKNTTDIETCLYEICKGEIIRWAIIEVTEDEYKISYAYKK